MRKREPRLLGTSHDKDALLKSIGSAYEHLEDAVEAGALVRTKITNQWLYAPSSSALRKAREEVEAEAVRRIRPWFLGATSFLPDPIARASASPRITVRAVKLLLRELAQGRSLMALGLLTSGYEPYLGLYVPDDADEVSRQVDFLISALRERGYVQSRELPPTKTPRDGNAWRSLILRHGEFRGLGRLDDGVLRSWKADLDT